jgi:hypothetical protein
MVWLSHRTGSRHATTVSMARNKEPPSPDSLETRFAKAHQQGIESLKAGDYDGLGSAIATEKALLKEQGERVNDLTARVNKSIGTARKSDS